MRLAKSQYDKVRVVNSDVAKRINERAAKVRERARSHEPDSSEMLHDMAFAAGLEAAAMTIQNWDLKVAGTAKVATYTTLEDAAAFAKEHG